jgi:3-dehydroquinate synthase
MKSVRVNTKSKAYTVYIANDLLKSAGSLISKITGVSKAAIITDDIVGALYSKQLEISLKEAGFETIKYVFQNGESSKNTDNLVAILNFLAENRLSNQDMVFALGGGVVGDIAGFAAAIFMRGIKLVQIPTTLLAMVDSSVGGKTAVDLPFGKNLAGAFYQPELVICDTSTLSTLDNEQLSNGFSEILKYAFIRDFELLNRLKSNKTLELDGIIESCVKIKRDIVELDECDKGIRNILNFGHTFGHSIEKCSNFTISHGKAVAVGMAIMTKAGVKSGICERHCYDALISILQMYNLPTESIYGAQELYNAAISDKKRKGDKITLIIPEKIGKCILKTVPLSEMRTLLQLGLN